MQAGGKSERAFRTIGELAGELSVPQHILRYWETRFPQLRPLQRAGNRRYYRPDDVALVKRIHRLLNEEGYTIRGVQKLLDEGERLRPPRASAGSGDPPTQAAPSSGAATSDFPGEELRSLRRLLADALDQSAV